MKKYLLIIIILIFTTISCELNPFDKEEKTISFKFSTNKSRNYYPGDYNSASGSPTFDSEAKYFILKGYLKDIETTYPQSSSENSLTKFYITGTTINTNSIEQTIKFGNWEFQLEFYNKNDLNIKNQILKSNLTKNINYGVNSIYFSLSNDDLTLGEMNFELNYNEFLSTLDDTKTYKMDIKISPQGNENYSLLLSQTIKGNGLIISSYPELNVHNIDNLNNILKFDLAKKIGIYKISIKITDENNLVICNNLIEKIYSSPSLKTNISYSIRKNLSTISGIIHNVTNNLPISNVTVTAKLQDQEVASTQTNETGAFELKLPKGSYTIEFNHDYYQIDSIEITIGESENTTIENNQLLANPKLSDNQIRAVLTWNETPRDLDFHLQITSELGDDYIYYGNRNSRYAQLDLDDTNGYGPETITITGLVKGEYKFYVYNFTGNPAITTSNAQVNLYTENGLYAVYKVPVIGNSALRTWNVFKLIYDGASWIIDTSESGLR